MNIRYCVNYSSGSYRVSITGIIGIIIVVGYCSNCTIIACLWYSNRYCCITYPCICRLVDVTWTCNCWVFIISNRYYEATSCAVAMNICYGVNYCGSSYRICITGIIGIVIVVHYRCYCTIIACLWHSNRYRCITYANINCLVDV